MRPKPLNKRTLTAACDALAEVDPALGRVLKTYGTPPLWDRPPGFATLLQIILEQQVSLASAKACFEKLGAMIAEVTPERVLSLSDADLRTAGFSRQKAAYARHLAEVVISGKIDLDRLHLLSDANVRAELQKLKGVGVWTSDIYLIMALLRPDVMPRGDLALHTAWQKLAGLPRRPAADEFLGVAERWRPFRSVAARLMWHFYLSEKAARRPK